MLDDLSCVRCRDGKVSVSADTLASPLAAGYIVIVVIATLRYDNRYFRSHHGCCHLDGDIFVTASVCFELSFCVCVGDCLRFESKVLLEFSGKYCFGAHAMLRLPAQLLGGSG